ncbi:uncharacterized protein LOC143015901 [Genypterus blacodes]|uniref:uncharacterized protein LOC143015901 n=1 Tax=Genypterus blacodes TaxID=154954 RepID=UPI003F769515
MESNVEQNLSLVTALVTSVLGLNPSLPFVFCEQVFRLYQLQSAAMRRRRAREMMARGRRLRQYLRRRRAFLLSSIAAVFSLSSSTGRSVWVRKRSQTFWAAAEDFDEEEWKSQFRLSRSTFDYLAELIGPAITRRRTTYREPIEPRRRLAIALWWYAKSGEYRTIAAMFGVGIATVCLIIRQVTAAIVDRLYPRFVRLPSGKRLEETIGGFRERCYPQCAGALGATHIPICTPKEHKEEPSDYINMRGWHSIILQAVVDHNVCFTDVYAGWPGCSHNSTVLAGSDLLLRAEDSPVGSLFPWEKSIMIDGVEVPVHLIGDASYPLKPWLMKGYSQHQLSPEQRRFTHTLTSARSVVDAAFTRLKGRWQCLQKKNDINHTMMARVVTACCVLHNICEMQGDSFFPEWNILVSPPGNSFRQPDVTAYDGGTYGNSELIRDSISDNLLSLLQY